MAYPSRVPLIFGVAFFGPATATFTRVHTLPECQAYIDAFVKYGDSLDSAHRYGEGTTDEYIGQLDVKGLRVDTKIHPIPPDGFTPERVRESVEGRVKALGPHKIRYLYFHNPDRNCDLDKVLKVIDELHKEGKFEEFGLSNHNSWEVAEIYTICRLNGWVLPTVYQGPYSVITRGPELELLPALRKYNIRFLAYSPLAGGLLAGSKINDPKPRGRFDKAHFIGKLYFKKYELVAPAVQELSEAITKIDPNLRLAELSLRWLQHHSALKETDGVLIGASSLEQLEQNCKDSTGGPLSDEILEIFDQAWLKIKAVAAHYATDL